MTLHLLSRRAPRTAAPPHRHARRDAHHAARGRRAPGAPRRRRSRTPVACAECHVVPTSMAHTNGTAELTLRCARDRGRRPLGDLSGDDLLELLPRRDTRRGWHEHRAELDDGRRPQAACGTCHGAPPPAPAHREHRAAATATPATPGRAVNLATHVNGTLDVAALGCSSCHGTRRARTPGRPPVGTSGETATTARAVGAHQQHLPADPLAGPSPATSAT